MRKNLFILFLTALFAVLTPGFARASAKPVLFIVAPQNFRQEEYFIPKDLLNKAGFQVVTASRAKGELTGYPEGKAKSDLALAQVRLSDYQALVFIGGPGAQVFWDDPQAQALAKEAVKRDMVLGAICIAPVTLARAGVLKGKRATVWPDYHRELSGAGAVYSGLGLTVDGRIVTAAGPDYARQFGEVLLKLLKLQ